MKRDAGFTLIELLVGCVLIGVLSTISVSVYKVYKIRGYDSSVDYALHHALSALEASKSNSDLGPQNLWAMSDAAGQFHGNTEIIPGLTTNPNTRITVFYNGWCNDNAAQMCPGIPCCITDWVSAWHCKGSITKSWGTFNDGSTFEGEFQHFGGC